MASLRGLVRLVQKHAGSRREASCCGAAEDAGPTEPARAGAAVCCGPEAGGDACCGDPAGAADCCGTPGAASCC